MKGPIFTTPVIVSSTILLCGSHSGKVFFINSSNGKVLSTCMVDNPIYGIPFVVNNIVCLANIKGEVFFHNFDNYTTTEEKKLQPTYLLNGDCFSSPILFWVGESCFIAVGCRDNYCYIMRAFEN